VWQIPGLAGQSFVLDGERFTGGIHGSIDGRNVLTCPWPIDERGSTVSPPCMVGGHQIVVYAESWDLGQTVRCDVFVDGRSLSTGELVSVISERKAAVRRYRSGVASWWRKASRKPTPAESLIVPIAIVEGSILAAGSLTFMLAASTLVLVGDWLVVRTGQLVEYQVLDRGLSPARVRVTELLIVLGCLAACAVVLVLAVVLAALLTLTLAALGL
jgi:hypothetical protein